MIRPIDRQYIDVEINSFDYGMVESRDERKLPKEACEELYDFIINHDGIIEKRTGREKANATDLGAIPHSLMIYREET